MAGGCGTAEELGEDGYDVYFHHWETCANDAKVCFDCCPRCRNEGTVGLVDIFGCWVERYHSDDRSNTDAGKA